MCASCSSKVKREREARKGEKEALCQQLLQIAEKHKADFQWPTRLRHTGSYTIEFQQALLEPAGRARLVLAHVVDVLKAQDTYLLTAEEDNLEYHAYFRLQCDSQQAQYVLDTSTGTLFGRERYALIIQIDSIHKPVAELDAQVDEDYAYIADEAAGILLIKGKCLDMLVLPVHISMKDLIKFPDDEGS